MKFFVQLIRIIVGGLFVFSGFVKLIDPIGSKYKFDEYFSESVLNLEFLLPYTLSFAIVLILLEISLGFMLLVGYQAINTLKGLFFLTLFFAALTFYSAYFNKVTDCGCFGDAITLTPWETFYKNIILLVLIFFLFFWTNQITPIFSKTLAKVLTIIAFLGFSFTVYYVLNHLPIIDFRPYAIGKNIKEGMEYKGDGKIPPVHDFMLENEQQDLAPIILEQEKVMLIISYNIKKADLNAFPSLRKIAGNAKKNKYNVYGVSASFADDLLLVKRKYNLPFEFLFCDETTLKTMIRANPGIMILDKGTVMDKKSWIDADEIQF